MWSLQWTVVVGVENQLLRMYVVIFLCILLQLVADEFRYHNFFDDFTLLQLIHLRPWRWLIYDCSFMEDIVPYDIIYRFWNSSKRRLRFPGPLQTRRPYRKLSRKQRKLDLLYVRGRMERTWVEKSIEKVWQEQCGQKNHFLIFPNVVIEVTFGNQNHSHVLR